MLSSKMATFKAYIYKAMRSIWNVKALYEETREMAHTQATSNPGGAVEA